MADDFKPNVDEMKQLKIAVLSLNPDPQATIQAYRDQRAAQQAAADQLVTVTEALVRATKRLGGATWGLVALTAVVALATVWPLLHGEPRDIGARLQRECASIVREGLGRIQQLNDQQTEQLIAVCVNTRGQRLP